MVAIRILDSDLNLLSEIDNYTSFYFTRKFRSWGDFQIQMNINLKGSEFLQTDNLILIQGSTNKIGIIKQREITVDSGGEGSEMLTVTGFTLDYLFKFRIVDGTQTTTGSTETIIKNLILNNCVNAADTDRNYNFLSVATDQSRGANLTWTARYSTVAEELEKISYNDSIAVFFEYKKTTIETEVMQAVDKSDTVFFSTDFDNIKSQSLLEDTVNFYNFAFVAGEGEGDTRIVTSAGSGSGLNRNEIFLSYNESDATLLNDLAEQELASLSSEMHLEGEVLSVSPFEYEKDWDLGYKVTIKNDKWGVRRSALITSVTEIYEGNERIISVSFGDSPTDLIDTIKTKLFNFENEVRR